MSLLRRFVLTGVVLALLVACPSRNQPAWAAADVALGPDPFGPSH